MGRSKREIMIDLVAELDKFGGIITEIQKAIESKGVTSEGKFSKLSEEIRQIQGISTYHGIVDAVERAYTRGYSQDDLVGVLDNLPNKTTPPNYDVYEDNDLTEVGTGYYEHLGTPATIMRLNNVVSIKVGGFKSAYLQTLELNKVTSIEDYAFYGAVITDIIVPSFVWNTSTKDVFNGSSSLSFTNIVISDESHPDSSIASQVTGIIYNHDKTKRWDVASESWVAL